MSLRKPSSLRTSLTLGAAVLAFGLGTNTSFAAGREGGHMAGMKAGGEGLGAVRSVNERFGAMRIERLSPAMAVHVTPAMPTPATLSPAAPLPSAPSRFHEPPVPPPATPGSTPSAPSATFERPSPVVQGPVLDPVRPNPDFRMQRPSPDVRTLVRAPVRPAPDLRQPPSPDVTMQRPTTNVSGPALDPVRPSLEGPPPAAAADN